MLYGQLSFPVALKMFLHYPVLVAHTFDFPILLAELQRRGILFNRLHSINLHFADPYFDYKRLVQNNFASFVSWTSREKKCLGVTKLYMKLIPGSTYNAHRALEDVCAMEKIFTGSSLASILSELTIRGVDMLAKTRHCKFRHLKECPNYCLCLGKLQLNVWQSSWMSMVCHMNTC